MAAIDQIVEINISQQTQAVAQASFSIPLIIGPTVPTSGPLSAYSSAAAMLTNGYTTSSPEYKYALELEEQPLTPTQFYVGQRLTAVEQIDTITPTAINTTHYIVTIDGTNYDYLSDSSATVSEIVAGLIALINADPNVACVASGSVTLILTAKVAGAGFATSVNANMVLVHTLANYGIQDDLNALIAINNSWYGIALCSNVDSDIEQLAAIVETLKKIFIGASNDAAIATSSSTDLASKLKGFSYKRTALVYSPLNYNKGIDAAWLGGQLPQTPGSNNWAFQSLVGISPDVLTDNQVTLIIGVPVSGVPGKNANIYQTVGGKNITQMGTMAGGQFIDITVGLDWLESTLQTNIFQALSSAAKIPYTDKGVGILLSAVKAAIDQGVVNGLIDGASPITISAPLVLSVPINQRALRIAPTISFSCRLQGAINAVIVNGTVTV